MRVDLHLGDCVDILATLPESTLDSVVSDPPYGLSFMQSTWDHDVPGPDYWAAALRVAKPGAQLVAFGGTRTFHRLACAIEDAGWEIRDDVLRLLEQAGVFGEFYASLDDHQRKLFDRAFPSDALMAWVYGQGFPKSHNGPWGGTALKPAWEPIVLARKPLAGTVAVNHAKHRTGGLNIDGCRIFTDWSERSEAWKASGHSAKPDADKIAAPPGQGINCHPAGRWPANVLLEHHVDCELVGMKRVKSANQPGRGQDADARAWSEDGGWKRQPGAAADRSAELAPGGIEEVADWRCVEGCPVRMLDEQSGDAGAAARASGAQLVGGSGFCNRGKNRGGAPFYADRGGASRFFYCSKATRRERGEGNDHPTVKPLDLMRYLVRLVTPAGGVVLDPFMGSGSTGLAAVAEGRGFVGIENVEKHYRIARCRIDGARRAA